MSVVNLWSGATTSTTARIKAKTTVTNTTSRLAYSTDAALTSPAYTPTQTPSLGILSFNLTGLTPMSTYYYAVEEGGVRDTTTTGKFTTFPDEGKAASFMFIASSCAGLSPQYPASTANVTNSPVFTTIADRNPLFFMHMGDMHYRDIATNDPALFRTAYDDVHAASNQATLFRSTTVNYVWDDHDFGPNDSSGDSPSAPASKQVFRERVPHYPLPTTAEATGAIYHSYVVGRVRFIVTDNRSERSPLGNVDDANKRVLSVDQENWFLNIINTSTEAAICWINSFPWIGTTSGEYWVRYNTQRTRLGQAIVDSGKADRFFMLVGDMHSLAIDNGTNNQWGGFPVFHFASLDSTASTKGGPYSHGTSAGRGRYGTVEVTDDGSVVTIKGTGYADSTAWNSYSISVETGEPIKVTTFRLNGKERRVAGYRLNGQDRNVDVLRLNGQNR